VAVLSAAFFVEFIGALANLVFELLRVARHYRQGFLGSVGHGVTSLLRKSTPEQVLGQSPKIGAELRVAGFS
jgi:hypothetical protein